MERIAIEMIVADMAMAKALQPRVEALGWHVLPGLFEQIFDAFAPTDAHVVIDALELDLGIVRADHLEEDTLAALRSRLTQALTGAILHARQGGHAGSRLLSDPALLLEGFGAFLASGVVPRTHGAEPFDAFACLRDLLQTAPEALIGMLRRRVHDRHVLERFFLQLGEKGLTMLLAALAPSDAETILALLGDILRVHRGFPAAVLQGVSEPALAQLIWIATLEFLLVDAGTQFNRRRFLARLIAREAQRLDIDYEALLALLAGAMTLSMTRSGLRSSLPITLAELLRERGMASPTGALPEPVAIAFAALTQNLEPAVAEIVMADLDRLIRLHAQAAFLDMGVDAFADLLRSSTMAYVSRQPSGRFDRRALWRHILKDLAKAGAVEPAALAASLHGCLERLGDPAALALQILPASEDNLAGTRPRSGPMEQAGPGERLALLLQAGAAAADLADLAGSLSEAEFTSLLARFTAQAAALASVIRALIALQTQEPLLDLQGGTFEGLVRAALLVFAVQSRGAGGRRAMSRAVLAALAAAAGQSPLACAAMVNRRRRIVRQAQPMVLAGDLPGGIDAAKAAGTIEWHRHIEHFLRTGQPPARGADLPDLIRSDPAWFASTSRRLVRERPDHDLVLAERLLDWLLAHEIVAALAPGHAVERLTTGQAPGRGDREGWRLAIAALLRGEKPPEKGRARMATLGRHDRMGGLSLWLARGGAPAGGVSASDLLDLDTVELSDLFLAESEEQTFARLFMATQALGREQAEAMLARLAPWAPREAEMLAATGAARETVLLRAAVVAMAGAGFDRADLARPLPEVRAPVQASPGLSPGPGMPMKAQLVDQLVAWLDGTPGRGMEAGDMGALFARLVDCGDEVLLAYIATHRASSRARARWAAVLPRPALARLVHDLAPAEADVLIDGVMLLSLAWRQTAAFGAPRPSQEDLWRILLDQIAEPRSLSVPQVLDRLVASLTRDDTAQSERIRQKAQKLARDGGYITVATALRRAPSVESRPAAARKSFSDDRHQKTLTPTPDEPRHRLYVGNAGLVLLNPYLPMFFERLGLLVPAEGGRRCILPGEPATRAVHLLQYLADGRLERSEPELVLNKLLSGQPLAQPVARSFEPSQADIALCHDMLQAVVAHWPVLAGSSPEALQQTFLQREGRLQRGDAKWALQVQRKTLDVLTDQVPWSFAVVYHDWMTDPIHVTW